MNELYPDSYAEGSVRSNRRKTAFEDSTRLWNATFEADNGTVPPMRTVRSYVDHWQGEDNGGNGLLLWGASGTGKTFAAAAAGNRLMEQGIGVCMVVLGRYLNELPCLSGTRKLQYLEQCFGAQLLILDDVGSERATEYAREQLYTLVNERYLRQLPMVITTNLTLNELKNPSDEGYCRIFDRILEVCTPICFNGKSLRPALGSKRMEAFRTMLEE